MPNLYATFNTPVRFDGDIIITDPCYIIRDRDSEQLIDTLDFERVSYPEHKYFYSILDEKGIPAPASAYPDYIEEEVKSEDMTDDEKFAYLMELIDNICIGMDRAFGGDKSKEVKRRRNHFPTRDKEHEAYMQAMDKYYDCPHDDWDYCDCGAEMGKLGITNSIVTSTRYGDWSCTTVQLDNHEDRHPIGKLGNFCADAGLVGVFLLDEVLKYNPDYKDHLEKDWTTTLIKDFHGEIMIKETIQKYEDEETGEVGECPTVSVMGNGNINFETVQTGF